MEKTTITQIRATEVVKRFQTRNKIVVAVAVAAWMATSSLVYARKKIDSPTKIDAVGARYGFKTCADPGPAAVSGLPVSPSACER